MEDSYDVVVMGGAFSGASTALLLKRDCPALRVLVIERAVHFDRKVGEATTEISGSFLTKRLCLQEHLNQRHISKHGLRFWFNRGKDDKFEDCGELGPFYQVRLPSFQIDRAVLDEHVLSEAVAAGAELVRPAKVESIEMAEGGPTTLRYTAEGMARTVTASWLVDASGKAAVLSRKMGNLRPLPSHPTSSIWARFRNVKDWDGHALRSEHPEYASSCQASRAAATNHLTGYGWWCWIIPLKGGDYSAGLVYDQRLFTPPTGPNLAARLKTHLLSHPVGREIFGEAEAVEGDVKAFSTLPYFSDKIAGPGWQIVGDAAGFMDPLYSQGLDYCAWTVSSAVDRIVAEQKGEVAISAEAINVNWQESYHRWFRSLYLDKYHYLGDKELMTAAFLLDLGLFFYGPVRAVVACPRMGFATFPFGGPIGKVVAGFMEFYNRRLAVIAQKRLAAGVYGASNLHSRTLIKGFEPSAKSLKLVRQGIGIWLRAEWRSAFLPGLKADEPVLAPEAIPATN